MSGEREGRPLRILHVTTTMDRGGAENHIYDLIMGQLAGGRATVACAYLKGGGYWRERLEAAGVETVDLAMKRYGAPGPFLAFRRLVRRFRPDIVHAHGAPAEIYALAAKTFLTRRPKLVVTRHELRLRLFDLPGYAAIDRAIAAAADKVIAVSDAVRRADVDRHAALGPKSTVIHHGFDAGFTAGLPAGTAARIRRDWGVADGEVLIGSVARLSPEKSLDTLLRAFALLQAVPDAPPNRLVMVGRGPLDAELKALAETLGIAPRVIWAGFREDVHAVFAALDLFAFTSIEEGFGMVLLEAMAAAKPIVAADIYAPPAVVGADAALLFPPADAEALAKALEALVRNPELRARLGAAGSRRLARDFTLQAMIDETAAVYDAALAPARG